MADPTAAARTTMRPAMLAANRSGIGGIAAGTYWISLRYFCITRLAIGFLLLAAAALSAEVLTVGALAPILFLKTVLIYVPLSAVFLILSIFMRRSFYMQLAAQLALDLVVLTVLLYSSGGPPSGLAALFLLPVAGAAILSPAPLALLFAALSSLSILGESVWRELTISQGPATFVQAGLYGASSFAIALVMNRLAAGLISQERIARQRGQDLQSQIEINRAVVADMQDGVLTLSAQGQPRSFNPSAARMMQIDQPAALIAAGWGTHVAGSEISKHFLAWRAAPASVPEQIELVVRPVAKGRGTLPERRLRVRFVVPSRDHAASGDHVVILEDLVHVEERAQQLKLASMGRLTASIAHEIRNPLAAISHASALMAEDADESVARLSRIVQDNTRRLNRIVENILQLSRRGAVEVESIEVTPYLSRLLDEFCREQGCAAEVIDLTIHGSPVARFNGEHLRQVLFNLLHNAQRHASGRAGSIGVTVLPVILGGKAGAKDGAYSGVNSDSVLVKPHHDRIEFIIQDDGPGVGGDARLHLFEPFFTTHHRGTGLGLYLARELCLANGATLDYVDIADSDKKGGFVINMSGTDGA